MREMTVQELYDYLSSDEFKNAKSGNIFYNYYIYQYPAKKEYAMRRQVLEFQERLKRPSNYVNAMILDLFTVFCDYLKAESFGPISLFDTTLEEDKTIPDTVTEELISEANSDAFIEYVHERINDHLTTDDNLSKPYICSKEIYSKEIRPQMHDILDKCALIAGQNIISPAEIGTTKSQERYKRALNKELSLLYDCATLVNGSGIPKNQSELASSIREATNPLLMDMPLSPAETKVKAYLDRQPHDVTMADIIRDFAKVPYGWSDYATIYITNELVRRHIYAFNYKGNPNVSREEVAAKIVSDKPSFTLEPAESISQSVINAFIDAWKEIFNVVSVKGGSDSTELFRNCKENADSDLNSLLSNYNVLLGKIENKPFAQTIVDAIALMNQWKQIRDPKKFFTTVADAKSEAATLFDKCKDINVFVNGPQWSLYNTILKFISDQQDNFHYLPADLTPTVEKIKLLRDEASPWAVLPSYKKMMAQLSNQLLTVKQSLIDEIKARYNKVFDDLEKYASEMNVPRSAFALRDITIAQKIGSNNFSTLKLNLDIAAFFAAQMDRINAAIPTPPAPKPQPSSEGDDIPPAPPTPAPRIRKVIKLNIATSSPMRTPADVDLYLAALREEILQQLDDNTDIIIQ